MGDATDLHVIIPCISDHDLDYLQITAGGQPQILFSRDSTEFL